MKFKKCKKCKLEQQHKILNKTIWRNLVKLTPCEKIALPKIILCYLHVDALELKVRVTVVGAGWVYAVFVGHNLPELGTNLVTALAALNVYDLTHIGSWFKCSRARKARSDAIVRVRMGILFSKGWKKCVRHKIQHNYIVKATILPLTSLKNLGVDNTSNGI